MRRDILVAASASIGSLLFGYDTGVIAGALLYIKTEFGLSSLPLLEGLVVTGTLIGAVFGVFSSAPIADKFGRRRALLAAGILFGLGGGILAYSPSVEVLILGRVIVGVGVGLAGALVPLYIAECAPPSIRGLLATFPQLLVSSGVLVSYLTDFFIAAYGGGNWRLMLGLSIVPAALQFFFMLILPESPRWLLMSGRKGAGGGKRRRRSSGGGLVFEKENEAAALTALAKLRGLSENEVRGELEDIKKGLIDEAKMLDAQGGDDEAVIVATRKAGGGGGEEEGYYSTLVDEKEGERDVGRRGKVEIVVVLSDSDENNNAKGNNEALAAPPTLIIDETMASPLLKEGGGGEQLHHQEEDAPTPHSHATDASESSSLNHRNSSNSNNNHQKRQEYGEGEENDSLFAPLFLVIHRIREMFSIPSVRSALLIGMGLNAMQQLCGINVVVYFTPQVLREAGVHVLFSKTSLPENASALLATSMVYSLKIPAIFLAMRLMDSLGRRRLLLTFVPCMCICLALLAVSLQTLSGVGKAVLASISICIFGVVFVLSLGPIPGILSAELLPNKYRGGGMAIATGCQWICNAIVAQFFPKLQQSVGTSWTISGFATVCALSSIWVFFFVPETRGIALEQLHARRK